MTGIKGLSATVCASGIAILGRIRHDLVKASVVVTDGGLAMLKG